MFLNNSFVLKVWQEVKLFEFHCRLFRVTE